MNDYHGSGALKGFGQRAHERITTNSAVNPLLWLCVATLPFLAPIAYWGTPPASDYCLTLMALIICAPIVAYFIFMFKDPDRLQSENYQLENQRMHLIGDERLAYENLRTIDATLSSNSMAPTQQIGGAHGN